MYFFSFLLEAYREIARTSRHQSLQPTMLHDASSIPNQ